jgi:hypothetical protein
LVSKAYKREVSLGLEFGHRNSDMLLEYRNVLADFSVLRLQMKCFRITKTTDYNGFVDIVDALRICWK